MQQIIDNSGVAPTGDGAGEIQAVMNANSPAQADNLIMLAHNYLAGRQMANPAWEATGSQAQIKAQLSGKGERALRSVLTKWQVLDPSDQEEVKEALALLKAPQMQLLFDTTGRAKAERVDAAARALLELEIHNPELFADVEDRARAFIATQANLKVGEF